MGGCIDESWGKRQQKKTGSEDDLDGSSEAYRLGQDNGADHAGASVAHLAGGDEVLGHVGGGLRKLCSAEKEFAVPRFSLGRYRVPRGLLVARRLRLETSA